MKNHEKAFSDIKNYYNDITLNNLALINTLKDQVITYMLFELSKMPEYVPCSCLILQQVVVYYNNYIAISIA